MSTDGCAAGRSLGGDYERGFEAGQDSATANAGYDSGQSTNYDSQQGDVGFAGNDSGAVMTLEAISISVGSVDPIRWWLRLWWVRFWRGRVRLGGGGDSGF